MEKTNFLTIDCGTQSTRVMIFDKYGNILAKEKIEYEPYFSLKPGYAEQDANVFWNSIITGCQQIKERYDGHTDLLSSICA
ncbi:MAG TPA: FGGY family carbohydrate kinase, partial [Exilispira sp.]|nr:FGGY family carbohydrate kinase [Exilispira sp.]